MNVRLTILLVFVLVVFGGFFAILRLTVTSNQNDPWLLRLLTPTERKTEDEPWMYRISEDDLYRIEVSSGDVDAVYTREPGSFRWYIQGDPPVPVFNDKWAGTPLLLSGPRVNRLLAETIDDPARYGLDPPMSRIKVVDGRGSSLEFHMGLPTPDAGNQYARLVGHDALFTVPAIWAEVINRLALEPPYLRLYLLEEEQIVFVEVTDGGETIAYGWDMDKKWYYLGPPPEEPAPGATPEPETKFPVDEEAWAEVIEFLNGPRLDDVLEESVENPADYGLDPPKTTVRLGKSTGADMKFYLGDATPDGNHRYVMSDSIDDERLYAMRNDRAALITGLVSDPIYVETDAQN